MNSWITSLLIVLAILGFTEVFPHRAITNTILEFSMNETIVLGDPWSYFKKISLIEIDTKTIQQKDSRNPQLVPEYAPAIYFSHNSRNVYCFRLRAFEQRLINVILDSIPISIPFDGIVDVSQLIGQD